MKRKNANFTLVELLVVIGIIGILAALIMPMIARAKARANKTYCMNNLKQLGYAIELYAKNWDYFLPYACARPGVMGEENLPTIRKLLEPYVSREKKLFRCPSDNMYFYSEGSSYEWNSTLDGKKIDKNTWNILGTEYTVPLLFDIDNFHIKCGEREGKNYLYPNARVMPYPVIE